jgi:hypothetical protein
MIVTDRTRRNLSYRRQRRHLLTQGWIELSADGDPLWMLERGVWRDKIITDVTIGPDGKGLFIKIGQAE